MKILYLTARPREIYHTMHWPLTEYLRKDKRVRVLVNQWPTEGDLRWCDVVFCNTVYAYMGKFGTIKKPKIAFIEDIWPPNRTGKAKHQTSYVIHKHFDCLFVRYKSDWTRGGWIDKWNRPWYYLPHCVDPKLFRDWKNKKSIGLLSVGQARRKKKYALRNHFRNTFEDRKDFFRLDQGTALGEGFSKVINKAKITATSNVAIRIFAKTFEIPASMSCMACNTNKDMLEAGFIPGENYIEIDRKDIHDRVLYYLENDDERNRITLNGYNLVHERHTIQQRAKEFFQYVEDFLGGR